MTKRKQPRDGSESPDFAFDPVIVRTRNDGWTADKQIAFIQALAECGCVAEACERVGMSQQSAYALRARLNAQSFRYAWEAALDHAVQRMSDAAFSRAIKGVSRPVFFKGEQVGERIHHDERLTMFLLRYRDPVRYGKFRDGLYVERDHADAPVIVLSRLLLRALKDGHAFDAGDPPPRQEPYGPRDTFVGGLQRLSAQFDAWLEAEKAAGQRRAKAKGEGAES